MKPYTDHTSVAALMDRSNVDTDQIIPKQFLKKVERSGFGAHLFHDWRFNADGSENAEFELNKVAFKDARILVAGDNFGCGSSREHAPWAIEDYG
ncbi:MAG TPA: 3-isopropylmalate dehydratase small subunit, partial [Arenicellales bacterium]|nr:3-isopropylmalate dehydratase small subunit [Arenicellales bacterium]